MIRKVLGSNYTPQTTDNQIFPLSVLISKSNPVPLQSNFKNHIHNGITQL
jgi:hypothetical protein